jgi:hypothetical protein
MVNSETKHQRREPAIKKIPKLISYLDKTQNILLKAPIETQKKILFKISKFFSYNFLLLFVVILTLSENKFRLN